MIKDNLRLISYDAVVSFAIHRHIVLPDDFRCIREWIHIFAKLAETAESTELIKTYKTYWHLFKIANSKATIKSVVNDGHGNLIFTLSFKKISNFNFFVNRIGHLTDNR